MAIDKTAQGMQLATRYDKNKDGFVSDNLRIDALALKALDGDSDGKVSRAEFAKAFGADKISVAKGALLMKAAPQADRKELAAFEAKHGAVGRTFLTLFANEAKPLLAKDAATQGAALKLATTLRIDDTRQLLAGHKENAESIERGVKLMPGEGREPMRLTLHAANDRILQALAAGRVDAKEAAQAQHMVDEMADMMTDIATGKATIELTETVEGDRQGWRARNDKGDVVKLMIRPETTQQGEARFKLETAMDDGRKVSKQEVLSVRFDYQKIDNEAAIDVQFGDEFYGKEGTLDKKVHDLMREPDGTPKKSKAGHTIPDHHFKLGMPAALNDPTNFATYARSVATANRFPTSK